MKSYPGTYTDIDILDVGARFYVHNGNWYGRIILKPKGKYLETSFGLFELSKSNNKYLYIDTL